MKKIKVVRRHPKNLIKKDRFLFEHEYVKTFKKIKLSEKSNIFIKSFKFYRFNRFMFGSKYWKMSPFSFYIKLKIFIKNFLNFKENNSEIVFVEEGIWVANEKSHKYFHWFADLLQRVEYLIQNNYIDIKNHPPILLSENYLDKDYIIEILRDLNLKYLILNSQKIYKIKKLYTTTHASPSGNYDEVLIKSLSNRLKTIYLETKSEPQNNQITKIWISRELAEKRKLANKSEVYEILEKYNFEIIKFEDIKIQDQFKIVNKAEILSGLHGAGLTNMLFLNKKSKVIEVRGNRDVNNNCFYSLASALNLDYYYFLSEVENEDYYGSNYYIDPLKFEKFLKQFEEVYK